MSLSIPPPRLAINLPVLHKAGQAYKLWHNTLPHIARISRYTLGAKIDLLFIEIMELLLLAGYAREREKKISVIGEVSSKVDTLKFLLQTAWELKLFDNATYTRIATPLNDVGLDIGKWRKMLLNNNPSAVEAEG